MTALASHGEAAVRQHLAEFFALIDSLVMHGHENRSDNNLQALRELSLCSAAAEDERLAHHTDTLLADAYEKDAPPLRFDVAPPSDTSTNGAQLRAKQYVSKADDYLSGPQTTSITQHPPLTEKKNPLFNLTGNMTTFPLISNCSAPQSQYLSGETLPEALTMATEGSMLVNERSASAVSTEMQDSLVAQGCRSPESTFSLGFPSSSFASVHFLGRQVDTDSRRAGAELRDPRFSGDRLSPHHHHHHHHAVPPTQQTVEGFSLLSINGSGIRPVDLRRSRSAFPERRATFTDHCLRHKESGVCSQTTCSSCKSSASSCHCEVVFDAIRTLKDAVMTSDWWTATATTSHPRMNVTAQNPTCATHHTVPPSSILRKQSSVAPNPSSAPRADEVIDRTADVPVDANATRLMRQGQMRVVGISSLRAAHNGGDSPCDMLVDLSAAPASSDLNRSLVSCAFGVSALDTAVPSVGSECPQSDTVGVMMLNEYLIIGTTQQRERGKLLVGFNVTNNSSVVIKEVHRNVHCTQATLQQEIAVMKQLRHENIVPVLEVLADPSSLTMYLVTPYIDCRSIATLHNVEEYSGLPLEDVVLILHKAACGLEYLHSHRVVHGDVTPDNILIDSGSRIVLSSYGEGNLVLCEDYNKPTCEQEGKHSPAWWFMSPEQLRPRAGCARTGTSATDVWSLAVTTVSLLIGTLPFKSRNDIVEVTEASIEAAVSRAVTSNDAMSSLLRSMLSPDPANRPCASDVCVRSKLLLPIGTSPLIYPKLTSFQS